MAILGVTWNRSKTISDTRVSVSWELLEYRLLPKWQFLSENVFSASGCWKVNESRWKKEKKKIQLEHAPLTDPRSSRASLQQHRCFWERAVWPPLHHTLEVEGQQEKAIPAFFLPASSPFCKSTLASSHWFLNCSQISVGHHGPVLALTRRLRNPGSHANAPEYATSSFLIHYKQVGAILTRMVNISILHFGKVFFWKISSWFLDAPQLSHWWSLSTCRPALQAATAVALKSGRHWKGTVPATCRNAGWDELCKYIMHLENGVLKYRFIVQLTATRLLPGSSPPEYLSSVKLILFATKKHCGKFQLSPGNYCTLLQ